MEQTELANHTITRAMEMHDDEYTTVVDPPADWGDAHVFLQWYIAHSWNSNQGYRYTWRSDGWLAAWERTSNGSSGVVDGELGKRLGSNMKSRDFDFAVRDMPICRRVAPSSGTFLPCINTWTRRPPPSKLIATSITALWVPTEILVVT